MLVIRLARIGRRNKAAFRIVLQEKTRAPKSQAVEALGSYNPHVKERSAQIIMNKERVMFWLKRGAQPSTTIHNMLVELGVIQTPKRRSVQHRKVEESPKDTTSEIKVAEPSTSVA